MTLTGAPFLVLTWVVTLAVGGVVVWVWPRVAAARVQAVAARVGMLLGVNVLVLVTVLAQLNHTYLFYADWTDLFGALGAKPPGSTQYSGAAASAAAAAQVGGGVVDPGAAVGLPPLPAGAGPHDRVLHYTVTGATTGIRAEVLVALPASYFDPHQATRRYPVIEAFHGYPGVPDQWTGPMGLGRALDTLSGRRLIADAIVVAPAWQVPPWRDTECVNGGGHDPAVETWLTTDVPLWVESTFRVLPQRSAWATIGISAGAWCAAMAAVLHPQQYAAAIVLGGYFRPDFGNWRPFAATSPLGQRYDLVRVIRTRPPPVALWVETSHSDRLSYPSSAAFLGAARRPLSVTALVLTHAGHRASLWAGLLDQTLVWLGSTAPGFRA